MTSSQQRKLWVADSEQRPPLAPSDKNSNGALSRNPRTREVTSRYKSSTPFSSPSSSSLATPTVRSVSRRCPSPSAGRTFAVSDPKRALSADRRRPSRPSSPCRPATPVRDSKLSNVASLSDSKLIGGRSPEGLWPSTRSLCVSFQADSFTLPVTKRERPVSCTADRALPPSANRQCNSPALQRKATPERKRTPLRGRNADKCENSKPSDDFHARIVDRHRWPSTSSVKGNSLNRSMDLSDKTSRAASLFVEEWGARSNATNTGFQQFVDEGYLRIEHKIIVRRMSSDRRAEFEVGRTLAVGNLRVAEDGNSLADCSSHDADVNSPESCLRSSDSSSLVDSISTGSDTNMENHAGDWSSYGVRTSTPMGVSVPAKFGQATNSRSQRMQGRRSSTPGREAPSAIMVPTRTAGRSENDSLSVQETVVSNPNLRRSQSLSSSPVKLITTTSSSRGAISPSRTRGSSANSISSHSSSSSSILNFIAEARKGKKSLNQIEDAQQLRLLYNRYLQWRFINARANAALAVQSGIAEDLLYNVYATNSNLRHCLVLERVKLQQLQRDIKLYLILEEQVPYLDEWSLLEKEHSSCLSAAIEVLETSILRVPITYGATADIGAVKDAIASAMRVIRAMGSSVSSLLPKVERMNSLVLEIAQITAQERGLLDECGDMLSRTAAVQVEECSHRTHMMQLKQAAINGMEMRTHAVS